MRVKVDGQLCVGSGQCVDFAPAVFAQGVDGASEVIDETPPAELHALVREAWESCPVMAIKIVEE